MGVKNKKRNTISYINKSHQGAVELSAPSHYGLYLSCFKICQCLLRSDMNVLNVASVVAFH